MNSVECPALFSNVLVRYHKKRLRFDPFLSFQMSHEGTMMCHECKYMPLAEKRAILSMESSDSEISCCFYSFRKLRARGSTVAVAGYLDPFRDPSPGQLDIWQDNLSLPKFEDLSKAKFILGLIGDQFCDMVVAEQKCVSMHAQVAENKTIVWKPTVKGVREMCDACKTTLFNYHWTCGKCGLFVCLDCYQVILLTLKNERLLALFEFSLLLTFETLDLKSSILKVNLPFPFFLLSSFARVA